MECLKCGSDIGNSIGLCAACKQDRNSRPTPTSDQIRRAAASSGGFVLQPTTVAAMVTALIFVTVAIVMVVNSPQLRQIFTLNMNPVATLAVKCREKCPPSDREVCDWMEVVCARNAPGELARCKGLIDSVKMTVLTGYCAHENDEGVTSTDLIRDARKFISLPRKVDAMTTLIRYEQPDGRTLESVFVVSQNPDNVPSGLEDAVRKAAIESTCKNQDGRRGLEAGLGMMMTYLYSDRKTIFTQFRIDAADCE